MIEEAFLYLLTNANPSGALGLIIGDRLFPDDLPQRPSYPAAVYHVISAPRGYTMDGQDGATPFRFQVDLYATTKSEVVAMRRALLRDVSGFAGLVTAVSPAVLIHGVFVDNERDSAVGELEQAGPRIRRKSIDVIVWTKEG